MLVIIKSAPNTPEGKRGLKLARDMAADVCFIQNGVYFAQEDRLDGFCGTAYLLQEDARMRGLTEEDIERDIKEIDYTGLVELMTENDKVIGLF